MEVKQNKNNIVLGIIGALIGGFVASIPWILVYVYGNMIFSALAIIIAAGALFGYKKFNGPTIKSLPAIISVISLFCVIISTLVIIPLLIIKQEGLEMTIANLKLLYEFEPFVNEIMKDLAISILFTFLGISGIVSNLKRQITTGEEVTLSLKNNSSPVNNEFTANIEFARERFTKLNALSKENAISKEAVMQELDNDTKAFNSLKNAQIIRKYKGNYWFDEKSADSLLRRFLILYAKIMLVIILIVVVLIFICAMFA